jgi:adenylate cyclase
MNKKKKRVFLSIGLKLITSISIIFIISFAVMIFFASQLFRDDLTSFTEANNLKISSTAANTLEIYMQSLLEKSTLTADELSQREEELIAVNNDGADSLSGRLMAAGNDIFYLSLLTKNEEGAIEIKQTVFDEQFFALNGFETETLAERIPALDTTVSGAFSLQINLFNASQIFSYPVTGVVLPYQIENGSEANSIIVAFITTDMLRSIVQSSGITTTYIINEKGEVLIHPDLNTLTGSVSIENLPIYTDFHTNALDNGQRHYSEDGINKIGSYQRINFAGFALGVITTVDKDRAYLAVVRNQRRMLLISVIILTTVILFIYFFSKTITVPVSSLVKGAHAIEGGDYHSRVKPMFRDEIGVLAESFNSMSQGLEERERIKDAFGRFVNPEIAEKVAREELTLGGESKQAAVFFSDIRSFTAISEKMDPQEVVGFLNEYMTLMVECIDKTHGVVDKFIGDAIMALWGTPVSKGNDTENAINAALMMREALKEFNKGRGTKKKPKIKIGCGINTGPLVAGQIGSLNRMEYTVIGDAVNLASRIEALNKPFHTDILISDNSLKRVEGIFIVEPMKKITVKGKAEPQQIYAVINRVDAQNGPKDIHAMRKYIGVEEVNIAGVDVDVSEEKFTIDE